MSGPQTPSTTERAGSAGPPAPDAEQLRWENLAAEGDVAAWPEVTFCWRTRRGWPTWTGWTYMAIPGVLMVSSILVALSIRSWAALLEFAFIDALIAGGTIGCLVTAPWSFHRETATWSLTISSSVIRLGKQVPGLAPVSQEIQRPDAGNLDLLIQQRAFGKGGYTTLAWAAGSSLDGATTIRLDNYSVATGTGVMGLLRRVQVAVVLVSWWPANSLTSPTIQAFERAGLTFWQPDGAPPRPKVPFARLDR